MATKVSYAEQQVCLSFNSAKKLYIDYKFVQKQYSTCNQSLLISNQSIDLLETKSNDQQVIIDGLVKDKTYFKQESDNFKDLYTKADKERVKAIENKPSALRWFSIGAVTSVIAFIAMMLVIKK